MALLETVFAILWTDFLALGVVDPDVELAVVFRKSRRRRWRLPVPFLLLTLFSRPTP